MRKFYTSIILFFLLILSSSSFGQIEANDDSFQFSGFGLIGNVLTNDTLNGNPVTTTTTVSVIPITNGPISVDSSGQVILAQFIQPGVYTINYEICEIDTNTGLPVTPSNCDTATINIIIFISLISAVDDGPFIFDSNGGTTPNVLSNDTINGVPITPNAVVAVDVVAFNGAVFNSNGTYTISPNVSPGTYTAVYQICEISNPTNCNTAVVTFLIQNSLIINTTATYNDFNNDGFVNVGDVVNYQYSLTNNDVNPVTNISLSSSNTSIFGGTLASLASGATDNTTFTGTHVITQNEINTNTVNTSVTATGTNNGFSVSSSDINTLNLPLSDGIRLVVFLDINNNGIQDLGENYSNYLGYFVYSVNSGSPTYIYPSGGVAYLYESNPSILYNLSFNLYNNPATLPYYTNTTSYSNVTVSNGSGITTYSFPVQYNPFTDLGVNLYNYSAWPRPGFTYNNVIHLSNNGTQIIPSGTVTFTKDANVTITAVNQTVTNTPTGFTYNFTNLIPFETRYIIVAMQVPPIPTVAIGQTLTNTVSTTIPAGDVNTLNNNSNLTQTIVGSYDPNDKQETHGGQIVHSTFTSNDYLTYTIRFENTGTAEAINVRVEDVLDSQLDETSLQMIASSHDYVLERVGNNLVWKFDGINLPPSVPNTQIGHGYITFQIKPKPGYAIGDIIPNFAEIYFDFNPAIITNICTTEFVTTLSNQNFAFNDFNYYPNPVKNSLHLSNSRTIDFIEISTIIGQKIISKQVNLTETELNLNELTNGVYFLKIVSENQEKIIKLLKE